MAKSSRASNIKANNAALKAKVFGPVEAERNARLHAKLMALVSAPKPSEQKETDVSMDAQESTPAAPLKSALKVTKQADDMEVDSANTTSAKSSRPSSGRIEKKRVSRNRKTMVFPKYKDGKRVGTTQRKKQKIY